MRDCYDGELQLNKRTKDQEGRKRNRCLKEDSCINGYLDKKEETDMRLKKMTALFCAGTMLFTALIPASVVRADIKEKLPFSLKKPTSVSLSWLEGADSQTAMSFACSKDNEMSKFLAKGADPETHDRWVKEINQLGYDDIWINAQIDWAIDDPVKGWHYTKYWDTFGYEIDEEGRTYGEANRVSIWDVVDNSISPEITDEWWIFRGVSGNFDSPYEDEAGEIENSFYYVWNGRPEDSERGFLLGLKSQLKDGQYKIVKVPDGDDYLTIDYKEHTVYARARFAVTARPLDGGADEYYFSEWSDTVGYGKDVKEWEPYTKDSLAAPDVSELRLTTETFNDDPVAAYTLTVPEELAKGLAEVKARGGRIRIETEMRAKGTEEWKGLQGDFEVKSGEMKVCLQGLPGEGRMIPDGTELEFRCRYWCNQYKSWNGEYLGEFHSDYSGILTMKTTKIGNGRSIYDTGTGQGGESGQPDNNPSTGQQTVQTPEDTTPISSLDTGASATQVDNFVTSFKNEKDPKGTKFGFLFARQKKVTKNAITITWKQPVNAAYYVIYGAKCGKKNPYEKLAKVTSSSFVHKKLNPGTYYRYIVAAFDSSNKLLGSSNTVHVATKGGKYDNYKSVVTDAKKNSVILAKKGAKFKLKGKGIQKSTTQKINVHRRVCYETSDKSVAVVDKNGKVTAVGKGKCEILVYVQNGVYQKIKVTVTN